MLLILICLILGLLAGLVPGLHANTLTSALLSINIQDATLPLAIMAMFGAQAISSYIPAIFLGIPDEQVVLSVLPGQRMAKEGRGLDALTIMVFSSIIAILACIALFPVSQILYPIVFPAIQPYLPHILILGVLLLVIRSKNPFGYLFVFAAAGVLGREAFIVRMTDPFLPLFSGMFAMAAILTFSTSPLPAQKPPKAPEASILKYALVGVLFGWIADLLPGVGSPAQIATFASILVPFASAPAYLAAISSIGVSQPIFALSTAATIGKGRVGSVAEVSNLIPISENLIPLLALFIIGTVFACLFIMVFRKKIGEIAKIDYKMLNLFLAIYLIAIVFLLDSWAGILVFAVSTLLGLLCIRTNVERTAMMGAIILPTILLLLFSIN